MAENDESNTHEHETSLGWEAPEPNVVVPVAHAMEQGDRVKGYRKMSEEELALFNEGKELALLVGAYVKKLEDNRGISPDGGIPLNAHPIPGTRPCDQRWVAIGKTQLQQGFMAIYRGIAQPEGF